MADITAHELSVEVLKIVNKDLFTVEDVIQAFNEGLGVISFRVLLPKLRASAEVLLVSDANVVDLPTDYQRNLFFCYSTAQKTPVRVFNDRADVVRYYGDPAIVGDVKGVAVFGGTLYYQNISTAVYSFLLLENGGYLLQENGDKLILEQAFADTLVIDYYKQPTTISERTDTFVFLPPHLIRPLLVNYASAKLFEIVEQGKEDPKNNSIYYSNLFDKAVVSLREAYPTEIHRG